ALRDEIGARPRAALYYANGYTLGDQTLAGQILLAAGFDNVASAAGYDGGGTLPLELLVTLLPEVVVEGQRYPGASRSEAILDHPALGALGDARQGDTISDSDWVCGTPFVLRAVNSLAERRRALTGQ
ncbi:MAG: ABC transporter substrate-binding protein, partial [Pseudomonadota bacterium]